MKKKILLLILTISIIFGGASSVKAIPCSEIVRDGTTILVGGDGASNISGGRPLDNKGACEWGRYTAYDDVNAVRLTVVDKNGGRVSNSIDFYSGKEPSVPGYYRVSTEKKYRNELIASHTGYTTASNAAVSIELFANLPTFRTAGTGAATILRSYFTTLFASRDAFEMRRIFALMGYTAYNDADKYADHLLLIEPIFKTQMEVPTGGSDGCNERKYIETSAYQEVDRYARQHNISFTRAFNNLLEDGVISYKTTKICNCSLSSTYYYGTATEIFSMMEQSHDPILTYKAGERPGALTGGSIRTIINNISGLIYDDQSLGGLDDASAIISAKAAYDHRRDRFGLGTMHIWMKQIMEGCNGSEECLCPNGDPLPPSGNIEDCLKTCPDGTPIPEGRTAADYCCPNGEHVPEGHTVEEWCSITCKYDPKVDLTNNCEDGPNGSVRDIEDWACIFETKDKPANTFEGNFYHVNGLDLSANPYCSVACREEVDYRFSYPFSTYAGNKFTIASSCTGGDRGFEIVKIDPGTMKGTSVCRTAPKNGTDIADAKINYAKFMGADNDPLYSYPIWNTIVGQAWDNYQIALKKQYSIDNAVKVQDNVESGEHACKVKYDDDEHCTEWDTSAATSCTAQCQGGPTYADLINWTLCKNACERNNPGTCTDHSYKSANDCGDGNFEHDGHRYWSVDLYQGPTVSYTGIYNSLSSYTASYKKGSGDDSHHNTAPDAIDVEYAKGVYETAKATRDGLLNLLNQCNNFIRDYSDFDPEVTFTYKDPTYGGSFPLERNGSITSSTTTFYKGDGAIGNSCNWLDQSCNTGVANGQTALINSYDCTTDGSPCSTVQVSYPVNDYVVETIEKTYTFDLNMNRYKYMGKNGLQADDPSVYSNIEYNESYKNFGCPVFPISFNYKYCNTRSEYAYTFYFGYDNLKNLFGEKDKFTIYSDSIGIKTGDITPFEEINVAEEVDYRCYFNVYQEFKECYECNENSSNWNPVTRTCADDDDCCAKGTCDCGLNIIYRPISLDNPFPGEHGKAQNPNGRAPGDNWNYSFTNSLGETESATHAYITENRGVHTEEVYQETPIYEFILDSSNIRRIRKYNSQQKHNYTDFETLECYGETGEFCRSTFLENGETNGYFKFTSDNPNGGTCFGKTGTDDKEWNACRYQN